MSTSNPQNNEGRGLGALFILAPVFLTFILAFPGWFAATQGLKYRTVRALTFPIAFLITQIFAGLVFLCFGWFGALLTGSTDAANYIVGHTADLTLLTLVFNEVSVPVWHIVSFQIVVWLFIGRKLLRHIAFSLYDSAIQTIGYRTHTHPFYVREHIRERDYGYAKAEYVYTKRGEPPLLAILLVGLSSTPIDEFY